MAAKGRISRTSASSPRARGSQRIAICWRWAVVVFLLAPLAGSAATALGWGAAGHRIVGRIAEALLTDRAREAVKVILEGKTLADVSAWADEVRPRPEYRWSAPLHYVNLEKGATSYIAERDCPKGECVVAAIERFRRGLADEGASIPDRAEALRFLVHFVGDIHQPLHASPVGDRGGNDVRVTFFGQETNLHRVWDEGLLSRMETLKPRWVDEQLADIQSHRDKGDAVGDRAACLDPVHWAEESYRLALNHAYVVPEDKALGQAYFERNQPVVKERLELAGIRLAQLLNTVFEGPLKLDTQGENQKSPSANASGPDQQPNRRLRPPPRPPLP